ncbi:MFS transporter [Erwinia sorbitola]|nr:MFS transporter [Erwinia sorbitola]
MTLSPIRTSSGPLYALAFSMLISSMGSSIANVGLPTLTAAFHASFPQMQWVVLAYLLAVTASVLVMGWLGDRFGRQRLLAWGVLLFSIASLGCGLATQIGWLIAARILQGLGGAMMMANTLALAIQVLPPDRTGRAMGLLGTVSAIGTALGPALGGVLIAAFGWQALFLVNLPLGLLAWGLVQHYLPHTAVAGTVTPGGSLLALLRQRVLMRGLLMSMAVTTVMMTTFIVGPFYLSHGLQLSPRQIGLVMAVGPLVAALSGVPAGRLVDRYGAQFTTAGGLAAVAGGCLLLAILPQRAEVAGYIAGLILLTMGYALFQAANNTALLKGADPARRGLVSGLMNLGRNLGFIVGAALMAAVYGATVKYGDFSPIQASSHGLRITFLLAGMIVLGAMLFLHGNGMRDRQRQ